MTGYTKLFGSILASTIWSEPKETKVLWITMLAMAGKYGEVHASIPGLAHTAHLTVEETESSLQRLMAPDTYSRTKDFEGRRIQEIDGGWQILNHAKYRKLMSIEERKEYLKLKQAESRARKKSTPVNTRQQESTKSTHAEAEADSKEEKKRPSGKPKAATDAEFFAELRANPAYEGIDIEREFAKMTAWCSTKGQNPSRIRFVNWLNRADRPMKPQQTTKAPKSSYDVYR